MNFKLEVKENLKELINLRRYFHQFPELGFKEFKTSQYIKEFLFKLGLEVFSGIATTGVMGLLKGKEYGKTILIRADMDALPVIEENYIDYKSKNEGISHCCGHDAHMSILLITSKILSKYKDEINGNIKFIFQPAEEGPGGAQPMIEHGVLNNPNVDLALGLHVLSNLPVGKIGLRSGPVMASSDFFDLIIYGKGGHGALPHETVDPIIIAAFIITNIQTIISRRINPIEPVVISFGAIHGGNAKNIIPSEVFLNGTVRTMNKEIREQIPQQMEQIIKSICESSGAKYELNYTYNYPVLINDEKITEIVKDAALQTVGENNVIEIEKAMWSEDMSYFLQKVPGCFFFVGAGNPHKGFNKPHHNPEFNIDEDCLGIGLETLLRSVFKILK